MTKEQIKLQLQDLSWAFQGESRVVVRADTDYEKAVEYRDDLRSKFEGKESLSKDQLKLLGKAESNVMTTREKLDEEKRKYDKRVIPLIERKKELLMKQKELII